MRRRIFISQILAGIVTLVLATIPPAVAQAPFDPPGFAQAIAAQEANTDRLLAVQGVVGTGVGVDARGQAAVVIMTDDVGVRGLPRQLDGVSVVVKVTGRFRAVHHREGHTGGPGGGEDGGGDPAIDRTARFDRAVPIGVSTGNNTSCSAGTIGARVTDGSKVYALSNNHVYALENNANIADLGDSIAQPGRFDTGCTEVTENQIGSLSAFVPLHFDGSDNTVDAAIAESSTGDLDNGTPPDGYGIPSSATVGAFLGQLVQKYGRTTGPTSGTVAALNATVNVGYDSGTARFVGQIIVDGDKGGFLNAGDSGSLLVDQGSPAHPVGLLFASGRGGKIAIASPIDLVLGAFGVTIDDR
jgi:hypothetical protein